MTIYHDGQEVTVIDAKRVRGRGVIVRTDDDGGGRVRVAFVHYVDGGDDQPAGQCWEFYSDGEVPATGMTIEPHPFLADARAADLAAMRQAVADGKTSALCFYDARTRDGRLQHLAEDATTDEDTISVHNPNTLSDDLRATFAEIARLREALDKIANHGLGDVFSARDVARAALSPDPVEGEGK